MPQVELVLAVGRYAQAWHLGDASRNGPSLTETVPTGASTSSRMPRIMPLPHPSWRNTAG
jgi:uracil-DNA glycosylase